MGGAPGFLCRFLFAFIYSLIIAGLKRLVYTLLNKLENMDFAETMPFGIIARARNGVRINQSLP